MLDFASSLASIFQALSPNRTFAHYREYFGEEFFLRNLAQVDLPSYKPPVIWRADTAMDCAHLEAYSNEFSK